ASAISRPVRAALARREALRARAQLDALHALSAAVGGAVGLEETLQLAAVTARELLGAPTARLELLDQGGAARRAAAVVGTDSTWVGRLRPASEGLGGWLLAAGRPLVVFHRSRGLFHPPDPALQRFRYADGLSESMVGVPLRDGVDRTIGFLAAMHPGPERFGLEDMALLERLGDHVSLAIAKAVLLEAERQRAERSDLLAQLNRSLLGHLELPALAAAVAPQLARLVPHRRSALLAPEGDGLVRLAVAGGTVRPGREIAGEHGRDPSRSAGTGPQRRETVAPPDLDLGDLVPPAPPLVLAPAERRARTWAEAAFGCADGDTDLVIAPLRMGQRLVGVLVLRWEDGPPTEEELWLVSVVCDRMSMAVENIRLHRQARDSGELARQEAERFKAITSTITDLVCVLGPDRMIRYASPSWAQTTGLDPDRLTGTPLVEHLHPDDRSKAAEALSGPWGGTVAVELRVRCADGGHAWVETVANPSGQDGTVVTSSRVITERKQLEVALVHQAHHDSLTGLPNRTLLLDRLQRALLERQDDLRVAVLFLDLDRFKSVNDSLGHDCGDELLVAVSQRLRRCVRGEDTLARMGGDEFVVLLEDLTDDSTADMTAARIAESLRDPFALGGQEVHVTASVGIAFAASGGELPADLLRDADAAMYRAKEAGRDRFERARPLASRTALGRLRMEASLRRAMQEGELVLHYQPVVGLARGDVIGLEALVRWQHPAGPLLGPATFARVAEESGLAASLGRWVLDRACADLAGWGGRGAPFFVAVNCSASLFRRDLVEEVRGAMERHRVGPGRLELELTEVVLAGHSGEIGEVVSRLRELGVGLAIDDFGTGCTSLQRLRSFPAGRIKIDGSFISRLGIQRERDLVASMVGLAGALGMTVTAEGVETADQAAAVVALGCHAAQGWHFGAAVPASEVPALL
ncbi:MAG: EAL domain-containing protein, partial [Acidimicrobiales bacterium]